MTMFCEQAENNKRKGNANLRVVVRLRPANEAEHNEKYRTVTHAISEHMLVFDPKVQNVPGVLQAKPRDVNRHRFKDLKYAFDHVFGPYATNRDVFEHATKGVVNGVLNGYNCSVFAYGATGAGKTHTMLGSECEPGVIYFTMMDLYRCIEEQKKDKIFDVAVSYSEVYNEQVRDLLVPRGNLPIREDKTVGVIIAGLSLHKPKTAEELLHMLHFGNKNRTQHPTDANAESSRSHAVFQVFVNQRDKLANLRSEVVMAKMCLVDLAGSERAHHTTNCGARFREGANINRSLLALGNVINALADNKFKGHIPYRDSKLTRLLKDSLGGNCRTVMIAAVSPSSRSFEDTYNTLRYADRAKHIRADIKKNVMNVDFHITNYKKYVQDLEKQNEDLRRAKQHLLESLEKAEIGSNQSISPIMRQLQERLKDLFKVRRDIRKVQMESEGAKRELKWKVSRRELAIRRVQRLTGSASVLSKHNRVIERMRKRIDKEEQALHQSTLHIQDQDNAIRKAVSEFTLNDCKQAPELLDLNARIHIMESNLYDGDMYLAFVKKLARAQERQASVTESLVMNLLHLVKKQHDVLHSQDLLSPELQHKYEQCCYLVEERGVTFSQPPVPSPLHQQQQAMENCREVRVSPPDAAAAPETPDEEENLKISDIIDIHIPRLRIQGLIQNLTQAKPYEPQRVVKPVSAVKPAARVPTQEQTATSSPAHTQQPPYNPCLVSQGTFSKAPGLHTSNHPLVPSAAVTTPAKPTELGARNSLLSHEKDAITSSQTAVSGSGLDNNIGASSTCAQHHARQVASSTHHQFQLCAAPNLGVSPQRMESSSPPSTSQLVDCDKTNDLQPSRELDSPVSMEANSSTENLNRTFQVLQPALPNTPCIDARSRGQNTHHSTPQHPVPSHTSASTPRRKKMESSNSHHRLNFQPSVPAGDTHHHGRSLLGQGDGQNKVRNQFHPSGFNSSNINSNAAVRQTQNIGNDFFSTAASATTHPPISWAASSTKCLQRPAPTPFKAGINQADQPALQPGSTNSMQVNSNNANSASPKSYAEALKSPPVHQPIVKIPATSKSPSRVKVASSTNDVNQHMTITTPDFSLSQLHQRLQLSCQKPPARIETAKLGDHSESFNSPAAGRVSVKTPTSSQPPARVKVAPSSSKNASQHNTKMTPEFSLSQFKHKLQLSCKKLPVRIETANLGEDFGCDNARKPLQALDPNRKKNMQNFSSGKSLSVAGGTTSTSSSSSISNQNLSQHSQPQMQTNLSNQTSLKLKARPVRRHQRVLGAPKPYSVQSPRRHRKWPLSKVGVDDTRRDTGHGDATGTGAPGCPNYMQPTFARAQKMLGLDVSKPPQRQADNPPLTKRTFLHKQRLDADFTESARDGVRSILVLHAQCLCITNLTRAAADLENSSLNKAV